ncbi:MAG TPA: hypothetical protein VGL46_21590 [Pseudonocardiaceae bacterium]
MSERGEQNWQPIDMLPVLTNVVAEMLDGAAEHERLLREAPRYSLDAATLDDVERVYRDGAADHGLYREQAARWQRSHPGAPGLAELAAGADQLDPAYQRVLALAAARRGDTIEALHGKTDLQVGEEALLAGDGPATDVTDEPDHNGEQDLRRVLSALVFDLIGGYLDEDADRVAQIAGQVRATGRVGEALSEALRFVGFLTQQGRAVGARLRVEEIRSAVLSRLSVTLPPHYELAVSAALDLFLAGRADEAVAAFGEGPDGDMIALHALTAYGAMLGEHLYAPGAFTSDNLAIMGALMSQRRA